MELWGWERFFEELESFLRDINRQAGIANESYCEYAVERLETCIHSVSSLVDLLMSRPPSATSREVAQLSVQLTELLQCLRRIFTEWQAYIDADHTGMLTSYTAPVFRSSSQGRPKFIIILEQLQYLCSMSFSWIQIAKLLGVSYNTVYRRHIEFGMTDSDSIHITDN